MRKPDFARVRKALLLQGEPDYVPLFDSLTFLDGKFHVAPPPMMLSLVH